jgi:hypothetical protein
MSRAGCVGANEVCGIFSLTLETCRARISVNLQQEANDDEKTAAGARSIDDPPGIRTRDGKTTVEIETCWLALGPSKKASVKTMRSVSRTVIAIVLACQWTAVGIGTAAGAYPERAIRLVVGFPAGGSSDAIVRIVLPNVEKKLGQSLFI